MIKTLALILLPIACSQNIPPQELFSPSDNVEILTAHNFKKLLENSPTAWLVNFYNTTTAGSQEFAPVWKKFATEAASWRDLVRVGVLDCSKEINAEICREYTILAYPTVKYFHENRYLGKFNEGYHVFTSHKLHWLKRNVINVFQEQILKGYGTGKQYPRGILSNVDPNQEKLFEDVKEDVKCVILVVEDFRRPLGAEMALHFHRTPQIAFKRTMAKGLILQHLELLKLPLPHIIVTDRRNNVEIISHNISGTVPMKWVLYKYLQSKGIKPIIHVPKKLTH